MDQTDEHLMRRLSRGDESALGELMKRWQGPVWCFIDRMCGALGCTDDVHQDLWMRLFLYRRQYRPLMLFRSYLFAIAVNCCRTAMARGRSRRDLIRNFDGDIEQLPGPPDPPAIEALIAGETHALLHRAIAALPQAQRSVVLLYLLFDTSYSRIAEVLGKSPTTVRSHMHHALAKLRARLRWTTQDAESKVNHERQLDR